MSDKMDDGVLDSMDGADDLEPEIITLTGEDGEEYEFELLDREELNGTEYVALVPILGEADADLAEEEGELIFMKVVEDGDEEFLESLEDDDEYNRVSEFFTDRLSEFFDIE